MPKYDAVEVLEGKGENPVCALLKKVFLSCFEHPRRPGKNSSANLTTRELGKRKPFPAEYSGALMPHTDVPHYINPLMIECVCCLEGAAELSFTDGYAMAEDLKKEDPEAFDALCNETWHLARALPHYQPCMHTAVVRDTLIQLHRDGK